MNRKFALCVELLLILVHVSKNLELVVDINADTIGSEPDGMRLRRMPRVCVHGEIDEWLDAEPLSCCADYVR